MGEVTYDLPMRDAVESSFNHGASLASRATEALATRFWADTPSQSNVDSFNDEPLQDDESSVSFAYSESRRIDSHLNWQKFSSQTQLHYSGEHTGGVMTDVHSETIQSDQYLVFLSSGPADEFFGPIVSRIRSLTEMAIEEEDQEAIRPNSLVGLFRFLCIHRKRVDVPHLTLTSEGHLRAEWRRSRDHRVAIRFVDESTVSFVTFLPDQRVPARINRIGGGSSVEGFFDIIRITRLTCPTMQTRLNA